MTCESITNRSAEARAAEGKGDAQAAAVLQPKCREKGWKRNASIKRDSCYFPWGTADSEKSKWSWRGGGQAIQRRRQKARLRRAAAASRGCPRSRRGVGPYQKAKAESKPLNFFSHAKCAASAAGAQHGEQHAGSGVREEETQQRAELDSPQPPGAGSYAQPALPRHPGWPTSDPPTHLLPMEQHSFIRM